MRTESPVIERMQTLIRQWEEASNSKAIFLKCYQMMTSNTLDVIEQGEFNDSEWVSKLLHHFSDYYFVALDADKQNPSTAPLVWKLAHSTTRKHQALPLQNLLLGVNAHINYDLVLALVDILTPEWDEIADEQRARRYADYCHVNEIIAQTIDAVQDQVLGPVMPGIDFIDKLLGPFDELLISHLISQWRETVWQNACRLLDEKDDVEKTSLVQKIEEEALKLGKLISG